MPESALVVVIAAAESLVGALRLRHDPAAAVGVPAHVTILYPFRPIIDDEAADTIAAIARATPAFDVSFASVRRFTGDVVYLAPEPAAPFCGLIAACRSAFPDCPPYGGAHPDPLPHLTVADGVSIDTADELDAALGPRLPVETHVDRLTLLREATGRWIIDRQWSLEG